jgi:hypothetical protein
MQVVDGTVKATTSNNAKVLGCKVRVLTCLILFRASLIGVSNAVAQSSHFKGLFFIEGRPFNARSSVL